MKRTQQHFEWGYVISLGRREKSSTDLRSELDGFIGAVESLKDAVNDPENIVGEAFRDLQDLQRAFKTGVSNDIETMWNDPNDERDSKIKLPDSLAPTTEDRNIIYVDPKSDGPFSSPNPLSPDQWRKDLRASIGSPEAVATGAATVFPRLTSRMVSSALGSADRWSAKDPAEENSRPLGKFAGKPMPTTPLPLESLLNIANASGSGDWSTALVRPGLRNLRQPEPPQQTADGIPKRRLGRRTYSVSPAPAYDPLAAAAPLAPSDDANFPGGLLGRFAALAGIGQNQPTTAQDDDEEQAHLRALDAKLSSTGNIRDAVALYNARRTSRR